uniref:DUF676 domain-containing protein n=1 Tax=Tetranychus urticae TaxID=32264 RepID=T1JT85_TETUR
MGSIQAILDFSVELNKFVNINLFQRGLYQIRITPKVGSKIPHKIEINFSDIRSNQTSTSIIKTQPENAVFPPCIINGSAVSKTFPIMFKNEEMILEDTINFKIHLLVDVSTAIEVINKTTFLLDVELWFSEQDYTPSHSASSVECVASRQLILHFDIFRGLHYHLPVIFDYFHLSAITITIHGSLITLCLPYMMKSGKYKNSSKESGEYETQSYDILLFGCPLDAFPDLDKVGPEMKALRMRRAQLIHWQMCSIMLTAIIKLRKKLREYINMLPPWVQARYVGLDLSLSTKNLSGLAKKCYQSSIENFPNTSSTPLISYQNSSSPRNGTIPPNEYDYVTLVENDMAHICSFAIFLWQSFLKVVTNNDKIIQYLAKVHHLHRIKRFSEAFFTIEKPRKSIYSICDQNTALFNEISEQLRKSSYLSLLPQCNVECLAMDGDANTLPIIYEEQFDSEPLSHSQSNSSLSNLSIDDKSESEQLLLEATASCSSNGLGGGRKNLREKFLNNLNRLNFGYKQGKEEYSPISSRGGGNLNYNGKRSDKVCYSPYLSNSTSASEIHSNVTLLGFRKFDHEIIDPPEPCHSSSSSSSDHNSISSAFKSIKASESLPDLNSRIKASKKSSKQFQLAFSSLKISESSNMLSDPVKPPEHFRDKSSKKKSDAHRSENEFHGTVYFPKPPLEFTDQPVISDEEDSLDCDVQTENAKDDDEELLTPRAENPPFFITDEPQSTQKPLTNQMSNHNNNNNSSNDVRLRQKTKSKVEPRQATAVDNCGILDIFKNNECFICGDSKCSCSNGDEEEAMPSLKRLSAITSDLITFVKSKEDFRNLADLKSLGWNIYSDFTSLASRIPYFQCDPDLRIFDTDGLHLVVCVHGLGGNSADLRLVKTYLEIGLPTTNFEFLMSQKNQGETFESFDVMTSRLVQEINYHIEVYALNPTKISFIGHSLGNIIIRACISHPEMRCWRSKFHTFLSLSGPHLGTVYNNNGLVNMGLWFMQKLKKSESLLQLSMKDSTDPRKTFLYKLSQEPGLEFFRYILLCGSSQDHYVPIHSSHIELCTPSINDTSMIGISYREMVTNLLHPIVKNGHSKLIRYDVHHALSSNANSIIGRAAHIAVLDSELFIEKFMVVVGLKYFV